ncbi:MAG: hypothetical protein Q7S96_00315 [bacterium]|nr:hypothetical protein [bacterium]
MSVQESHHADTCPVDMFGNLFVDDHPYTCRMRELGLQRAVVEPILMPVNYGFTCGLQFMLSGSQDVLVVAGEVQRHDDVRITVRFTSMLPATQRAIVALMERSARRQRQRAPRR